MLFLNVKDMRMKESIVIISLSLIFSLCKAQQEVLYTQYIFSQLAVNPAYAGNNTDLSLTTLSRKQWIGLDGSPTSVSLFADGLIFGRNQKKDLNSPKNNGFPLFSKNKQLGLGLILFNDMVGVNNTFQASLAYSYKIKFSSYTRLSLGLQIGVLNFSQSFDKLNNINQSDEVFQENVNLIRFNIGSGVFFETEHYFVGLSSPSFIRNSLDSKNSKGEVQLRQYFLSSGYLFYLHPLYKLKPTIMMRYTEQLPVQFDLNIHLIFNDRIWTGLSYRYKNSINIYSKLIIFQSFSIGLAYDIPFGEIRRTNIGSAEILLSYVFQQPKKRIINPRYF